MRKITASDLIGKTHNGLTIKSFHSTTEEGRDLYICTCFCGTEVVLDGVNVRNNKPRTCGCNGDYFKFKGQRYGSLTVIENSAIKRSDRVTVRCDCGTEFATTSSSLRYGYIISCGCKLRPIDEIRNREEISLDLSNMGEVINNKVSGILLQSSRNFNRLKLNEVRVINEQVLFKIESGLKKASKKELNSLLTLYKVSLENYNHILNNLVNKVTKRVKEIGTDTKLTLPELIDVIIFNALKGKKSK